LLALSDLGVDSDEGQRLAAAALDDGRAAAQFERWCYLQGGRWKPGEFHRLAAAKVVAPRAGFVGAVDAYAVGRAAQLAGAGRQRIDADVDPEAGVVLTRKVGEPVATGDLLATVYARDSARRTAAKQVLEEAFSIVDVAPVPAPVVLSGAEAPVVLSGAEASV